MIMEKRQGFGLRMSLKQLAIQRVASNIWNETDVLSSIQMYLSNMLPYKDSSRDWQITVENKVKEKISILVIPEPLKKEMIPLVTPIGSDTQKWLNYMEENFGPRLFFDVSILEQICRTDKGAIDDRKTADKLVRLQILDVYTRYQLASMFCLVDYIPVLWKELPEVAKITPSYEKYYCRIINMDMGIYWAFIIMGQESELNSIVGKCFNKFAFKHSARKGNKAAAKYFYQKLRVEERDIHVIGTIYFVLMTLEVGDRCNFPIEKVCDVVRYLFSMIHPEEQLKVLKKFPCIILKCFLDWPWQDFFLELVDIVWTFLPESSYECLLLLISSNIRESRYYISSFLQSLFLRSPMTFRKCFVRRLAPFLFPDFVDAEDTEIMKIVFRNADAEDRAKLINSYHFLQIFSNLVMKDRWDLIELLLREAALSEKNREEFKKSFYYDAPELNTVHNSMDNGRDLIRKKLFKFLDEIYSRSDGETLDGAKRICREKEKESEVKY